MNELDAKIGAWRKKDRIKNYILSGIAIAIILYVFFTLFGK